MKKILGAALLALAVQAHAVVFTFTFSPTPSTTATPTVTPTVTDAPFCPYQDSDIATGTADNYGVWDGVYLWITSFENQQLYRVVLGATPSVNTYSLPGGAEALCMAYDGANLWIGGADTHGTLYKYNRSGSLLGSWQTLPSGDGFGGIQGILWDGTNIWLGISQTDNGGGQIARWDSGSSSIDLTIGNQNNVNGISYYVDGSAQEWILGACDGFVSQVNATTAAQGWQNSGIGYPEYRVTNDGTYAYTCTFTTNPGIVNKFLLSNGDNVAHWNIGSLLNQITWDGQYLWTVGDDHTTNITDTNGNRLCTYPNTGRSDAVYAYNANLMFTNDWQTGHGSGSSTVNWFQLPYFFTPTVTPTVTATYTETPGPPPTDTPLPSLTVTPTQTYIGTPTFTATSTPCFTVSPTSTPTPNWTATASPTAAPRTAPSATPTWGFF